MVISLHLTLQGCCDEKEIVWADSAAQCVLLWERKNDLKDSHSGKSSFYTHAHVKEGAVKEVRRMERCNERGEEHSFMSRLTQGHEKVPQAAQLRLHWTVFPTLLALFQVHFFSGWIYVYVSLCGLPLSVYWVTQLSSQICTHPSSNCCRRPKCITLLCSIFSCSPPTTPSAS